MGASVEDSIRLRKFRLLSFVAQKFESGNIELAQGALRAVESLAADAQNWLNALNLSELLPLSGRLEQIKQLAKKWQEVLKDIWRNRGQLRGISESLEKQKEVFSGFLKQIDKIRERKLSSEEYRKVFVLREKVNEIVTYLGIAKLWVDKIIEEIRAKKGR
jgi:DNA repair exonuclease SbcCD ATPase subunit